MDTEKILYKEIELIEACISRMAHNSFLLKGWVLSLFAILLTVSIKLEYGCKIGLVIAFTVVCFWYLDAFFLRVERKYRKLYDWVITNRLQGNMENVYSLDTKRFEASTSIAAAMFSRTLLAFYVPIFLASIVFLAF